MYSKKTIALNCKRYEQATNRKLVRHPVKTCRQAVDHFNDLLLEDGSLDPKKRPNGLLPDEKAFIKNEIALCRIDFCYWLARYVFIKDADSDRLILFNPNPAQKIMLDVWGMLEEKGLAVAVVCLKARQHGISTLTEIAIAHRIQFRRDVNAIVGSSDPSKSELMSKMMETAWANQPWWMMPSRTVDRRGSLIEFGGMNSGVSIQHGSQFTGIGRGGTPSSVHLCVDGNEFIIVQDGTLKTIKEVTAGDTVLTADGNLNKVRATARSPRKGTGTSVDLWTLPGKLLCTDDHPVLTDLGFVEASQLKKNDFVIYPVRPITAEVESEEMRLPSKRHWHRVQKNASINDTKIYYNRKFGRVCGLYLAEGTIQATGNGEHGWLSGLIISMHDKEREMFSKILLEGLPLKSKESIKYKKRSASHSARLTVHSAHIGEFFSRTFGRTIDKRIPDWVWTCGREFCVGLIEGYLLGDGHIPKDKMEMPASSICAGITYQLQRLIASCGFGWTSIYARDAGMNYGRNCKKQYTIHLNGETAYRVRKEFGWELPRGMNRRSWRRAHWMWTAGGHIGIQVRSVSKGNSDAYYDLEIDSPEHNFTTIHGCVHNSEVASFENPEELIDASLMGAFHESPDRFIVLESTAEGNTGYWFDTWSVAVNSWPRTLFYPVFIPWFVATTLYPTVAELKRNPVPENWEPSTLVLTHKQKAELYVRSRPELRKHLGKDWTLSIEKMWWWECTREAYKAKKELNLFLQEFTSDPDESFQSTNISAFDADLIAELRDETKSKPPKGVYSITGATVSDRLVADARDADSSKEPIQIRCHWDRSIPPLDYELYPLKFRSYVEDPMDRLYVWELPQPNVKYVLGVDTSDGVGQDRGIVQVLRLKNPFDPNDFDEQVAEFASPYVNSRDLWPIVLAIATWYSTPQNGKVEQNRVVIECNGNGETVQHEIRKLGWWNFHPWEHYDNRRVARSNKIGWFTNVRTRSMAVDTLVSSIRDGWLKIRSPWFVQEMQAFERDESRQALRAAYGSHDDRLMSCAFALCSSYIHEITTDGRTFFSHQRKRITAKGEKQLTGLTQAQLTAKFLKEQGVGKKPYSGNYSPY